MTAVKVVNMIPASLSGESSQDSEPNIAVNPENPSQIVGTAFTPDPLNGSRAPVFVSVDGGLTWALHAIVPGGSITHDISVAFGSEGGALYAGTLNASNNHLNVLRTTSALSPSPMTVLVNRPQEDQPWASATTAAPAHDRVYVGHNDFNAQPHTASVELSQDARAGAAPAGFDTKSVEKRATVGQDGPPVRPAIHPDGTVYAGFQRWVKRVRSTATALDLELDVVVVRDDAWAGGAHPFTALTDPGDGRPGVRVAKKRFIRFTGSVGPLGQERIGADLSIAVDPTDSDRVWIAWCDRIGGASGTDWTIHVRRSTNRGRTWSSDRRTVTNAKNPALAVNAQGTLGFMFQRLVGTGATARWRTMLELTDDGWASDPQRFRLHSALASSPHRDFLPYLGDYIRLLTVGDDYYGVFSGSNKPDPANFPSGVTYQRNANWTTHKLFAADGATPVPISIDPFFVRCTPGP
jgi:hypothetical protein